MIHFIHVMDLVRSQSESGDLLYTQFQLARKIQKRPT
jgi:hypothetical protein